MASPCRATQSTDDREAVIRELTRGYELTEQLQAEAARARRADDGGDGRAEAAGLALREVSRAFAACLSILRSGGAAAASLPGRGHRRAREDDSKRKRVVTPAPYHDGYQWRKYGQKKILNSKFPRSYFRCTYHRDHHCPATKQVQQQSNSNPPTYLVIYTHDHSCNRSFDTEPATTAPANLLDFSGAPQPKFHALDGGIKEAQEREALVSSLASVIGGHTAKSEPRHTTTSAEEPRHTTTSSDLAMDTSEPMSLHGMTTSSAPSPLPRMDEELDLDVMMDALRFESYDMSF